MCKDTYKGSATEECIKWKWTLKMLPMLTAHIKQNNPLPKRI